MTSQEKRKGLKLAPDSPYIGLSFSNICKSPQIRLKTNTVSDNLPLFLMTKVRKEKIAKGLLLDVYFTF